MLSIDMLFMLDKQKTSILDMTPKRPDTSAGALLGEV